MPSSTMTLPHNEQRRPAAASGTATRTSTTVAPSAWARMRRDLVIWLVFSDITAVSLPAWYAVFTGGLAAAWPVAVTGIFMLLVAWFLGALGIDTVEQGAISPGRFLAATISAIPVAVLLSGGLTVPLITHTGLTTTLFVQGILAILGRNIESSWLHRRRMEGHGLRRTLIVMGSGAQPMLTQMRRHPMDGFLVVGYLSSAQSSEQRHASPVRDPQHISSTVHAEQIDVVMTVGSVAPKDLVTVMRGLEATTVRLIVAPGLQDVLPRRMQGLSVTHGWTGLIAVKTRRTRAVGKAIFDRIAGTLILLAASPFLLLTAIALRLDSPGPVFYTQTRVGEGGSHFTMWKFRSMYTDADARRQEVINDGGDAGNEVMFKSRHDPRITRVGRIIRRLSIDELPQLFNVVLGDMSLVGPRPALPEEVAQYDGEAKRRLLVKPGMTGLWQISGRSELSWASTVALDRHYVENRGGSLDAKIFLGTLRAVIGGKGAY